LFLPGKYPGQQFCYKKDLKLFYGKFGSMPNKRLVGLVSILFVMIVWGSSFAVTKVIVNVVPPLTLAFYRCSVGALTLLSIFFIRKGRSADRHLADIPWGVIILLGFTGVTVFYIFFNLSVRLTSASVGALLQGFIPVCIAVLAAVFLKEKLSIKQVFGIIISVTGVIFIGFLSSNQSSTGNSITGNVLMIIAVIAWGVYTIISKKVADRDPLLITSLCTLSGSALLLPAAIYENWGKGWPSVSFSGWLAILFLGALASGICYLLYNKSLQLLTAAEVGNFINLDPLVGFIIALAFLHESVNMVQIIGAVLIVVGIVLSTTPSPAEKSSADPISLPPP
jgi:drug/metabolite transporter (DMT)-like permease